jgi:ABC-type bacteriocin/lantibiotic exporter with double-glycine peptidase domain
MGCEDRGVQHWSDLFVDVLNNSIGQARLGAGIEAFSNILMLANTLAPLAVGTWLALAGQMTFGTMLMLVAIAGNFLSGVAKLAATVMHVQVLGAYLERIYDVLNTPREQAGERQLAPPLRGSIVMENVSFRYGTLSSLVLRDVSLKIDPGQFVAIVGPSGAGKTTLANLLLGLYEPTSGSLYFDGIDLRNLDLRSVRRQLGVVTQGHELFGTTIRENISLSDPSISLEDVMSAAQLAQIHDDISAMPLGYNTPLADRGYSLSGGQRQRLALARALVRRPAVLLLDEATSALDVATEQRVQHGLGRLRCTRIVIAHRLSTVMNADLILVLDRGTIVEAGAHRDLVRQNGVYARLVAMQSPA